MKLKKTLRLLAIFAMLGFAFSFIDFHSSMTKVDYNSANGVLRFTTKMKASDLQSALKTNINSNNFDEQAKRYVSRNIQVSVNGSAVQLVFTGSQVSGESVWVYYESSGVGNINTIQIKNTLLLNEFANQMNIVNIAYKGKQKTMTFRRGQEVNSVNF